MGKDMNIVKKTIASVTAALLFLASSNGFAEEDEGAVNEGGIFDAAGGINIGAAVALGVLGVAIIVESDDDGPSAPPDNRPPVPPVNTGTGTISTSGT